MSNLLNQFLANAPAYNPGFDDTLVLQLETACGPVLSRAKKGLMTSEDAQKLEQYARQNFIYNTLTIYVYIWG